jgi:hypothetical protein
MFERTDNDEPVPVGHKVTVTGVGVRANVGRLEVTDPARSARRAAAAGITKWQPTAPATGESPQRSPNSPKAGRLTPFNTWAKPLTANIGHTRLGVTGVGSRTVTFRVLSICGITRHVRRFVRNVVLVHVRPSGSVADRAPEGDA